MGLFNGDSIYKGGGGGGGLKDGGTLVDSSFIKLENNTISGYTNTSRDTVNFYFDTKPEEPIFAFVEMTSNVNTTVNVYYLENGILKLMGVIGTNTVTSGDNIKLVIAGKSYAVDNVTANSGEEYAIIDNSVYGIKNVNGLLWLTSNYKGDFPGAQYSDVGGMRYYLYNDALKNLNNDGWRLPQNENGVSEVDVMFNSFNPSATGKLKSTSGWYNNQNGTNESGMNFYPWGYLDSSNTLQSKGFNSFVYEKRVGTNDVYRRYIVWDETGMKSQLETVHTFKYTIRLVKSV